jgi:hypothetical protein
MDFFVYMHVYLQAIVVLFPSPLATHDCNEVTMGITVSLFVCLIVCMFVFLLHGA